MEQNETNFVSFGCIIYTIIDMIRASEGCAAGIALPENPGRRCALPRCGVLLLQLQVRPKLNRTKCILLSVQDANRIQTSVQEKCSAGRFFSLLDERAGCLHLSVVLRRVISVWQALARKPGPGRVPGCRP